MASSSNGLASGPHSHWTVPRLGRRLGIALALTLALAVMVIVLACYWLERGWTPRRLERQISSDLPPGTSLSRVNSWLDLHGFTHWSVPPDRPLREALAQGAGLDVSDVVEVVWANVPNPNVDVLMPGEISIIFIFNKYFLLINHEIRPLVYAFREGEKEEATEEATRRQRGHSYWERQRGHSSFLNAIWASREDHLEVVTGATEIRLACKPRHRGAEGGA